VVVGHQEGLTLQETLQDQVGCTQQQEWRNLQQQTGREAGSAATMLAPQQKTYQQQQWACQHQRQWGV
jgi:hypothetical protein